jgi:hypothetical protein
LSLEFKSFKKGRGNFSCLDWAPMQPKKLQLETLQKHKANKHKTKSLKKKEWKHEIKRAWKLTSSCCVVCVSPTSYKNKNTMNIYVKISNKKLGFPMHLFQETKLGKCNFKHNFVFFSLKKHLFIHTCYKAKWTQLKSTLENKLRFSLAFKTNDQWVFLLKVSKLHSIN